MFHRKYILYLLVFYTQFSAALQDQWGHPVYKQYTVSDGLPSPTVDAIVQDQLGNMWFGTDSGLTRFDGYNFRVFYPNQGGNGISNSNVTELLEDRQGYIWVGTRFGLNRVSPRTEKFQHFLYDEGNENSISNDSITSLLEDDEGVIWIGTGNGLNRYLPETESFDRFIAPYSSRGNVIHTIKEDGNGLFFLGTHGEGLLIFDPEKEVFEKVNLGLYENNSDVQYVYALLMDNENRLWMGTKAGLVEYHHDSKQAKLHVMHKNQRTAYTLYQDKADTLWVGYLGSGFCRFNIASRTWACVKQETSNFPTQSIRSIYESRDGMLWLGSHGGGVIYFKSSHPFRLIRFNKPHSYMGSIIKDSQGDLWIGAQVGGAIRLSKGNKLTKYQHDKNDANTINANLIYSIFMDEGNQVWIGTPNGLNRYDSINDQVIPDKILFNGSPERKVSNVREVGQLDSSTLLLSTDFDGLLKWNKKSKYAKSFEFDEGAHKDTPMNLYGAFLDSRGRYWAFGYRCVAYLNRQSNKLTVTQFIDDYETFFIKIVEDSEGQLWLLTYENLYKMSANGEIEETYNQALFGNSSLFGLVAAGGYLWVGGGNGLWRFDPDTQITKHFTEADGLQSNDFNLDSYIDDDGTVFMSGANGITIFHPDDIDSISNKPAEVILTDLRINNEIVKVDLASENAPISQKLPYLSDLTLDYQQARFFSIEFSAQDFIAPTDTRYAYKLEGINEDWVYTDSKNRRAVYTTLSPGKYTFRVKAANSFDIWNEEGTRLKITILPPWWRTIWAYLIYSILAITSLLGFIHYRTTQARQRAVQLEGEVKLRTQEINQQKETIETLLEKKNTLFANVSHEFRTPLTLILGPIKKVLNHPSSTHTQADLQLIKQNAQRLNGLVEQLLSFSKLSNFESTQAMACSLKRDVELAASSLASLMDEKKLNFEIGNIPNVYVKLTSDDVLLTIINNLLSNAVKYTPEGGQVKMSGFTDDVSMVHIIVQDSGAGVPEAWQDKIFERFSRISDHVKAGIPGTGLGLALVKELVEMNHGRIKVSNADEGGAVFEVVFPILSRSNDEANEVSASNFVPATTAVLPSPTVERAIPDHDSNKPTVQIIDDIADMRSYLRDELMGDFNVLMADDGESGLQSIKQHVPDIIICDIMMPGIDGLEVLQRVRQDEAISHIPVILLTAKSGKESQLEGLNRLADDYITKPFDRDILLSRIANLLSVRSLLRDYFSLKFMQSEHPHEQYQASLVESGDSFLQKFHHLIEQCFSDHELSVEEIASNLHMSARNLQIKLKSVINQTPREYLVTYRLKYAAKLLRETTLSIGEIQERSGFSNASRFAHRFKEQFKVSARGYRDQANAVD